MMAYFILIFSLVFSIGVFVCINKKYPNPKYLERKDGYIYHPIYGKYEEEVIFKPGMTLYPGQSTGIEVTAYFKKEGEKNAERKKFEG